MQHCRPKIFLGKLTALFVLFCAASYTMLPQPQDSAKTKNGEYLRAVMMNNERYVNVNELCRFMSLESSFNADKKKFEVKFSGSQIILTEGSPFVVTNDYLPPRQSVEQMSASAIFISNALYAPARSFLALFNRYSPRPVSLDTTTTAPVFDVVGLSSEKMKNGYLIRIHTTRPLTNVDRFLRNNVWLYVTISNAAADTTALNKMLPFGIVRELIAVQSPTSVQLAFFLAKKIAGADIIQDAASNDILVALRPPETDTSQPTALIAPTSEVESSKTFSKEKPVPVLNDSSKTLQPLKQENINNTKPVEEEKPLTSNTTEPVKDEKKIPSIDKGKKTTAPNKEIPIQKKSEHQKLLSQLEKQRDRWKLDVVVLDPGHGGNDPGAIGTIGTREKDITLGIALKLGKLIKKGMPDVKVVYTRKTDRFVELYRRGQIANENQGKLFISIHCNALERKPSSVNGFEIYLLRPGKTEDAIKVAQKENAVVKLEQDYQDRYQDITEENFIILTMAQSAYIHNSETFAGFLQEEMEKNMHAESRGVKQAGFYVLVGASMPNVLIETGYLSNPHDEKFLRSPSGQQTVAESIFRALERYKNAYEETLSEGG
jgi:N-acetylmuramoyl-L-alanine amidase